MKILISAYACDPFKGSEPGVGWGFIKSLSSQHDLCVITELGFKEAINNYCEDEDLKRVRFEVTIIAPMKIYLDLLNTNSLTDHLGK